MWERVGRDGQRSKSPGSTHISCGAGLKESFGELFVGLSLGVPSPLERLSVRCSSPGDTSKCLRDSVGLK